MYRDAMLVPIQIGTNMADGMMHSFIACFWKRSYFLRADVSKYRPEVYKREK